MSVPLLLLCFIVFLYVLTVVLYLCTFTLVDIDLPGWTIPAWGLFSVVWYVSIVVYKYYKTQSEYNAAMEHYNAILPGILAYNKKLGEELTKATESAIEYANSMVSGEFIKIWIDQNQKGEDGSDGMAVHLQFNISNMRNQNTDAAIYFFSAKDNKPLLDNDKKYCTIDGQVAAGQEFVPNYDDTSYNDFVIFMPYSQLHLNEPTECYVNASIWNGTKIVACSDNVPFMFSPYPLSIEQEITVAGALPYTY